MLKIIILLTLLTAPSKSNDFDEHLTESNEPASFEEETNTEASHPAALPETTADETVDDVATPTSPIEAFYSDNDDFHTVIALQMPAAAVIRCSRRFTPGLCKEPNRSVWTYVFDKQNCTERLGCVKSERSNRFQSYNRCVQRCLPLTNIYTHVLEYEEGRYPISSSLRRWHSYLEKESREALRASYYDDHDMRPVARVEPDYAVERMALRSPEYDLESHNKFMSPDVDSFGFDHELTDDFYKNVFDD